ncbi:Hypothetical protein, putative [Bodo saltans]|uniref:Uncharacterized protein n=1 Tax=Bodo saltans TaxID=75058 RepID=A0A0S4IMK8_BODSA|nr:Hypothetical protein, putative [Bodo saltans]|eukprot:CUF48478.1 Hypothetical protein, putative [Bodo saltans]
MSSPSWPTNSPPLTAPTSPTQCSSSSYVYVTPSAKQQHRSFGENVTNRQQQGVTTPFASRPSTPLPSSQMKPVMVGGTPGAAAAHQRLPPRSPLPPSSCTDQRNEDYVNRSSLSRGTSTTRSTPQKRSRSPANDDTKEGNAAVSAETTGADDPQHLLLDSPEFCHRMEDPVIEHSPDAMPSSIQRAEVAMKDARGMLLSAARDACVESELRAEIAADAASALRSAVEAWGCADDLLINEEEMQLFVERMKSLPLDSSGAVGNSVISHA